MRGKIKPELLAPAGSYDALVAAINAGCDAVYLSGYMFGARQFAPNFSREELIKAIDVCHIYGVKVYVTVNTLIYEEEVNTFMEYIDFLHKHNVDAVIMQDLGMIDLVHQTYPNLEIHASTQMNIHNVEGVEVCKELGIKRVVLARETNIDTIKKIKEIENMELEVFIHGALCVSYSGQCLMSSLIGGRSGNRGSCAGTCRLAYKVLDEQGNKLNKNNYVLSTKDLNVLDNIGELIDLGIESFKIEGRMKRSEYVFLVVSIYRKAIDSYIETGKVIIDDNDIKQLKRIFNRYFTKGFMFGEDNNLITNDYRPNHLGVEIGKVISISNQIVTIKLSDDLSLRDGIRLIESDVGCTVTNILRNNKKVACATKGDIITIKIDGNIRNNDVVVKTTDFNQLESLKNNIKVINKKVVISGIIKLKIGDKIYLKLSDGINSVDVEGFMVEEAIKSPLTNEQIKKQIRKLGSTPFELNSLEITKDDNVFINNKDLNEIRRIAVNKLLNERLYKIEYKKNNYHKTVSKFESERKINVLLENSKLYNLIDKSKIDTIYTEDVNLVNDKKVILKLPRIINNYKEYDIPLIVSEFGSLKQNNIFATDFSFNVTNSYSVAFLHSLGVNRVTLSYELSFDQLERIVDNYKKRYNSIPNLEVIVYGREEMMISKFSLNKKYNSKQISLIDRYNKSYPVREKNSTMYIYNTSPRCDLNIDRYFKIGINSIRYNIFDKNDILKIGLNND